MSTIHAPMDDARLQADRARLQLATGDAYRVLGPLGRGPLGVVFRAEDRAIGREVAVKLLAFDADARPDLYARLEHAVQLARDLAHPGIVAPLALARCDGTAFYVMPIMSGGSVDDVLRARTPISVERILGIIRDAAGALDHAHAHGVVHGGVKPANLLIDAEGRVRIADLGVATALCADGGVRAALAARAQAYAPPEQRRGHPVDGRADQYALAVIAYEMFTGARLLDAPSIEGIQTLDPVQVLPEVPLRLGLGVHVNAALRSALSASPASRFPTARAFATALEEPERADRTVRAGRMRHVVAATAVLLAALALAAIAVH
ncbi:MAG TPA: serine/threonine-protein kinase [Gemmatimonadaceae bacterium]